MNSKCILEAIAYYIKYNYINIQYSTNKQTNKQTNTLDQKNVTS